jgi:2'-5' RNA ligase
MSRITLITNFKEKELDKINHQIKNIDYHMCKVPYGINDELRYEIDNLPYHFTIFATDKQNERKLLEIANDIKVDTITLRINDIKIMNGKNNSFVLYFAIEENKNIKELQRKFFSQILGENYNPDKFTFHMTLHIDKDENIINDLKEKIKLNFKPFNLEFDDLALYNYPGDMIEEICIKK